MHVLIQELHHNPKYWIEPEKFIPERFDPKSKYFLTPKGKRRHLLAFAPFSGGKRVCIGKTLAENLLDVEDLTEGQDVIKPIENPIKITGHLRMLYGNLATEGSVAKITGKESEMITRVKSATDVLRPGNHMTIMCVPRIKVVTIA